MAGYATATLRLPAMRLDTSQSDFGLANGTTSTSEAAGYELDGAGLTISGRLCDSIKIREV